MKNILPILVIILIIAISAAALTKKSGTTQVTASITQTPTFTAANSTTTTDSTDKQAFNGEKGQGVALTDGKVTIATTGIPTNQVQFFNTTLADGKTIYFLVLKDKDGNFRAAANANKQCASYGKGYRQVGDEIECLTCNKKYPLSDFAVAQPDCNPYPINAKLPTQNNQIVISSSELEAIASLF